MKTILIVDDSKEIRELVKVTLGPENYQVLEADCGEAGVQTALESMPDLIIMDVKMPGKMNGFDAIAAIRKSQRLALTPVIVLSGSGDTIRMLDSSAAANLLYYKKPFSPLDLIEKIDEILGSAS